MKKQNFKQFKLIFLILSFCLVNLCYAIPTYQEIADTMTNLWIKKDFTTLESHCNNLYSDYPNYVPVLVAYAWYCSMFHGDLNNMKKALFPVICDIEAHTTLYTPMFKSMVKTEYNFLLKDIKAYQRWGITPQGDPNLIRQKYGEKINRLLESLFHAPNRDIPIPTIPNDDVQVIPVGQGLANSICIDSGSNGICETFAQGDDIQILGGYNPLEQTAMVEDETNNNPQSAPAIPNEGRYKLVDSSGTTKAYLSIGNSEAFEIAKQTIQQNSSTNNNLPSSINEIPINGEIQITSEPPEDGYPAWITENYPAENWENIYSIDQDLGGIGVATHLNDIPIQTIRNDDDVNYSCCWGYLFDGMPALHRIQGTTLGANGVCDTVALGYDIQVRPCVGLPCQSAISTGSDGICNTVVHGDDTQIILTNCGNPGATCVTAGPNLIRETHEKGDDVVDGTSILVGDNGVCESTANQ